jgi:hypothetical protein
MVDTHMKPPLEDPLHEREIFANEIAGIAMIQGNFIVTLAKIRFEDATEGQTAKVRRIVSGRLVLTHVAANQLLQQLQRIAAQIEAATAVAAGHKPN